MCETPITEIATNCNNVTNILSDLGNISIEHEIAENLFLYKLIKEFAGKNTC